MRQHTPDANFGSSPTMVSGALGDNALNEIRRALLRFDLSQIPADAVVNSASLSMAVVKIPLGPATSTFDLRRLLQAWNEGEVTWNARAIGSAWNVAGGVGASDSAPTASSSVAVTGLGSYVFPSTPGLMADVQSWVGNPALNFGWLLLSEDEATAKTGRHFATRESPAGDGPRLVVEYSVSPPLAIVSQPQSQSVFVGDTVTFSVQASGAAPLAYRWHFNELAIASATNDTLRLSNVQTNDTGSYTVTVTNLSGSLTSQPAILTVSPVPSRQPVVSITSPANGSAFPLLASVFLVAEASESNGVIRQVEFLLGTNSVGIVTNAPYSLILTNLAAGDYTLTARATDDLGISAISSPVRFAVHNPPEVTLIQPARPVPWGATITNTATVTTDGAAVTNVIFFEGDVILGATPTPPFALVWQPSEARVYFLTAVALDALGQSGTSAPVTLRVFLPETTLPTVKITNSPPNFARLDSALVTLAGTAADNIGVDHVEFQVNSGLPQMAIGTNFWTAEVRLVPGNNTVRVHSVDLAGNASKTATRYFTYVVQDALSVQVVGDGTVTPNLNGHSLEIGKYYTVTAQPGANQLFAGWTGGINAEAARLNFQMKSNLVLIANFVPNPFPPVAGAYSGVFFHTNFVLPLSSGFFSLQLGKPGSFSGKVRITGASYPFHGKFRADGTAAFAVLRRAQIPLVLSLQLDLEQGRIRGSVSEGTSTSGLLANRDVFETRSNPAPQAGHRSFVLQHVAADGVEQLGSGIAKISTSGVVSLSGSINDLGKFSLSTALGSDGSVPVYLSFAHGSQVIVGWMQIPEQPPTFIGGDLFEANADGVGTEIEVAPAGQ